MRSFKADLPRDRCKLDATKPGKGNHRPALLAKGRTVNATASLTTAGPHYTVGFRREVEDTTLAVSTMLLSTFGSHLAAISRVDGHNFHVSLNNPVPDLLAIDMKLRDTLPRLRVVEGDTGEFAEMKKHAGRRRSESGTRSSGSWQSDAGVTIVEHTVHVAGQDWGDDAPHYNPTVQFRTAPVPAGPPVEIAARLMRCLGQRGKL